MQRAKWLQRYVDILTNAGFKAVFGDVANKDAVMMIINQFLPKNRKVEHIDYLPTNYQGPVLSLNKEHQYDFMCRDNSGALFIVEMQCYTEKGWFQRCVSYASRAYDRQSRRGKDYEIDPVYLIGLMGVPINHPDKDFGRTVTCQNIRSAKNDWRLACRNDFYYLCGTGRI